MVLFSEHSAFPRKSVLKNFCFRKTSEYVKFSRASVLQVVQQEQEQVQEQMQVHVQQQDEEEHHDRPQRSMLPLPLAQEDKRPLLAVVRSGLWGKRGGKGGDLLSAVLVIMEASLPCSEASLSTCAASLPTCSVSLSSRAMTSSCCCCCCWRRSRTTASANCGATLETASESFEATAIDTRGAASLTASESASVICAAASCRALVRAGASAASATAAGAAMFCFIFAPKFF